MVPHAQHKVTKQDYDRAKKLRREMSPAEKILWHKLRQLPKGLGLSFRRQQPIHPYIADFICIKAKLIIELDGASHDARQEQDKTRDTYLNKCGYEVMRFANSDVLHNHDGVTTTITNRVLAILQDRESRLK